LKRGTNKLCVGSSSVYSSDTWPTKVDRGAQSRVGQNEMPNFILIRFETMEP